jgi:hypothetical protein
MHCCCDQPVPDGRGETVFSWQVDLCHAHDAAPRIWPAVACQEPATGDADADYLLHHGGRDLSSAALRQSRLDRNGCQPLILCLGEVLPSIGSDRARSSGHIARTEKVIATSTQLLFPSSMTSKSHIKRSMRNSMLRSFSMPYDSSASTWTTAVDYTQPLLSSKLAGA